MPKTRRTHMAAAAAGQNQQQRFPLARSVGRLGALAVLVASLVCLLLLLSLISSTRAMPMPTLNNGGVGAGGEIGSRGGGAADSNAKQQVNLSWKLHGWQIWSSLNFFKSLSLPWMFQSFQACLGI
jgi:hypothetical protein